MTSCKDIPPIKDFSLENPIDVQTENGIVQLFPYRGTRGKGREKWRLTIEGYCRSAVETNKQCKVYYGGKDARALFAQVKKVKDVWQVTLETAIISPAYWGDAQ